MWSSHLRGGGQIECANARTCPRVHTGTRDGHGHNFFFFCIEEKVTGAMLPDLSRVTSCPLLLGAPGRSSAPGQTLGTRLAARQGGRAARPLRRWYWPEKKSSPTTSPVLAFLHGPGECEGSLRVGSQQGREEQASPQHFRVPSWAPLTGLMSKLRPREGRMAPQGHMAVWK